MERENKIGKMPVIEPESGNLKSLQAGETEPEKRGPKPDLDFLSQVKKLRQEGLTNSKIAQKSGRSLWTVKSAAQRLIKTGEIERRRKVEIKTTPTAFLAALKIYQEEFPGKPVNLSKVAKRLGITKERARQIYDKLAKKEELPPKMPKGRPRKS